LFHFFFFTKTKKMAERKPTKPPVTTAKAEKGYCLPPEKLHNGDTYNVKFGDSDTFQPGDRVYFMCDLRYRLIGPAYRECGWNSKWDAENPYCQSKCTII